VYPFRSPKGLMIFFESMKGVCTQKRQHAIAFAVKML
jgi:hypothetical protein